MNPIIQEDVNEILKAPLPWDQLLGKTVLVTGANGFLPAYMVRTLLELSNRHPNTPVQVIGLVRNLEKARQRFMEYADNPCLKLIQGAITAPIQLDMPVDIIIHAASQASPKFYGTDPVGTLAANTLGTYYLLELAAEKKVSRFLYFSSSEVYGALDDASSITENQYGKIDPTQVRSCYAESKRMGETTCVSFAAQKQIPVTIARPFHTYGPGLALDDGRVFADFVANVVKGENIVMNSDGAAVRSFCYLADATVGFFTVLLLGESGHAYNVGNPDGAISIRDLANIVVQLYPEKQLNAVFGASQPGTYLASSFNVLCPNIEKISRLGWKPKTGVAEGFRRTIDSFNQ